MTNKIKNVCVFASSCNYIDKKYFVHAKELGEKLAQNGYDIVYGGSTLGLMGEITTAACKNGAQITGVMPEKLHNMGIESGNCTKFILTKGMRERKAKMDELSDAVIAIAGGFGTLEEISEMLVQKQLGYNNKPIVFLNTDGFYDELTAFFNKLLKENFAPKETSKLFFVAKNPTEVIEYIKNYNFEKIDFLNRKIILKNQPNV